MSHLFWCDVRHFWLWFAVFAGKESDSFGVTEVTYIIALTMMQTPHILITLVMYPMRGSHSGPRENGIKEEATEMVRA
jgi:hypothetical protein